MRILLAGGSGFIGRYLTWALAQRGHQAVLLSRTPAAGGALWDGGTAAASWISAAAACPVWINLCGAPLAGARWTAGRKRLLLDSRITPTRALVQALSSLEKPPRLLINASAAGFYGNSGDKSVNETAKPGSGFLAELCAAWEAEAMKAADRKVRTVCLRLGAVLGREGGLLGRLVPPYRMFLGGPWGSGKQWLSWIAIEDLAGLVLHLLGDDLSGPVNATAPIPVSNLDFSRTLASVLGRPAWLRIPAPVLRLARGEMADILLTGQKALPEKALAAGFVFKHYDLESALRAELL